MTGVLDSTTVAHNVTWDTYLEDYGSHFYEWVNGTVYRLAPVHEEHREIRRYLQLLLEAYLEVKPIGSVRHSPFNMRISERKIARKPDIMLVLGANASNLTARFMDGPADICIEVVSPESVARDHGEKFAEYEAFGVREYWIIDPLRNESRFYRADRTGRFQPRPVNVDGDYLTPNLPGLVIPVHMLWMDEPLPGPLAIVKSVHKMMREQR